LDLARFGDILMREFCFTCKREEIEKTPAAGDGLFGAENLKVGASESRNLS